MDAPTVQPQIPFPPFVRSYLLVSLLLWALLRAALLLFGLAHPSFEQGMLIAVITTLLVWHDHRRSRDNYFHASHGARLWMVAATSLLLIFAVELLV